MGKETFDLYLSQGEQTKPSPSRSHSLLTVASPLPLSVSLPAWGRFGVEGAGLLRYVWGLTVQPVMRQTTTVEL